MKSISFAICILAAALGWARTVDLDLRPGPALQSTVPAPSETGVLRCSSLASGSASVAGLAVGDVLSLRLYGDVELRLTLVEREESPLAGATFQASVEGMEGVREAVVIESPDGLMVSVQDRRRGRVYSIVSASDGVTVKEIDPVAEPSHCGGTVAPLASATLSAAPVLAATGDQSANVVDMLVAYDKPAANWAKQNGGITNLAQQCVSRMNTALANNGLSSLFRFRLVGVAAVEANGNGNLDQTLDAVSSGTGNWAPIKTMRDTVGADIVSTMIDTGSAYGTTGLGFSLTGTSSSRIASFANSAYNVISVRAAAQSHVMTHETGHNMGAGHSDMQEGHPSPQSCNYSRGYYFTGTDHVGYYTIMAYNVDADDNHYEQAPLFSSPNSTWQGTAAGDATHNNAQVLRDTYAGVMKFRSQKVPMSYEVFFSPESGALFSGSTTVSLTPGKSGISIRYTLDGSTPTATHGTLYSAPITITAATTIKAVAIVDGKAGMVYEARYYPRDFGSALNAPQLTWTTSSDAPWTVQSTNTFDGAIAVQSANPFPVNRRYGETTWLKTTVTGPTKMSFRYSQHCADPGFEVCLDGTVAWGKGESNWGGWALAEIDIPAGSHEVKFSWTLRGSYYPNNFNGVVLDLVQFDALSRPPAISPATTSEASTAHTFTGSMQVTLTPGTTGGLIYYTLDGSDPAGEDGMLYTGPITLTKSTLVRATEVDSGKDASAGISALYLERHPLSAGEWTTDVDGVKTAAAKDGKLICVLLANLATCSWCQALNPIANSKTFLAWAKANGVYLVTGDASTNIDAEAAQDWFWTLCSSHGDGGSAVFPTMYFAKPSAPNQSVGKGIARSYNGQYTIGSVPYAGTVESLIAGFESILRAIGQTPVSAPVSVADIFETEGVIWTNSSTVPWREEYPGQMRAGGLMSSTFSSVLSAKVNGKGKFIFSYRAVSYSSQNSLAFAVGGTTQWTRKYDGNTTYAGTVTNDVTSASGATFTWTCKVNDSSRDYGDNYSAPCGAWIYDVQWIPEGAGVTRQDGQGNSVVIPLSWFAANGISSEDADADADGDGMCNWHEYVSGTDPRNATSVLRCTIEQVNGSPVVDYAPKSGYLTGYHAVVVGSPSLENPVWSTSGANRRFFKVVLVK